MYSHYFLLFEFFMVMHLWHFTVLYYDKSKTLTFTIFSIKQAPQKSPHSGTFPIEHYDI